MSSKTSFRQHTVKADHILNQKEVSLVHYLSQKFTYFSMDQWIQCIQDKRLEVNQKIAHSETLIVPNDIVCFYFSVEEPSVNLNVSTVYEDKALWVVHKPHNLPVHPSGCFYENTLWTHLQLKEKSFYLINRLDRETAGLVLIAKTKEYAKYLIYQFEQRTILKKYYALVEGIPKTNDFELTGFIGKDAQSQIRKKQVFIENQIQANFKTCSTKFKLLKTFNNNTSLLHCYPKTGRTHQIRASLLFLNLPLVGDKIYGVNEQFYLQFLEDKLTQDDWKLLRLTHQCLQCFAYEFQHPITRQKMLVKTDNCLKTTV